MKKFIVFLLLTFVVLAMSVPAFATSLVDYAAIATALTSEITEGVPAFVALLGLVIGIPLCIKLVKRIIR